MGSCMNVGSCVQICECVNESCYANMRPCVNVCVGMHIRT